MAYNTSYLILPEPTHHTYVYPYLISECKEFIELINQHFQNFVFDNIMNILVPLILF